MAETVLICGSRNWKNSNAIERRIAVLESGSIIIHGDCRGADKLAGEIAARLGFRVRAFPADWKSFGNAAGPIRNTQMLDEGRPDRVIAFHENIRESKGTRDMVRKARERDLFVDIVTS